VAPKSQVTKLKRRHSRRLLSVPGVCGVGVERGDGDDDYVLAVYVEADDTKTRAAVTDTVGTTDVRIVASGKFRKQ
jgi:hypothetical protein